MGCSPWGRKESDTTEQLYTAQHTQIVSKRGENHWGSLYNEKALSKPFLIFNTINAIVYVFPSGSSGLRELRGSAE